MNNDDLNTGFSQFLPLQVHELVITKLQISVVTKRQKSA